MEFKWLAFIVHESQLMTFTFNFFITLLGHSDGIILTIFVPSYEHDFIVIITTNVVCGDMRNDVSITVRQLDIIRCFNKVKSFL